MDHTQAIAKIVPVLVKRLARPASEVTPLATAYVSAVLLQTVDVVDGPPPQTTFAGWRNQLVSHLIAELKRVPTEREVAAVLRVTESVAKGAIAQVLAVSDPARDVLLQSIFDRATKEGTLSKEGVIPRGQIWRMATRADFSLAQRELERVGVEYATHNSKDGNYELVTPPKWAP